LRIWSCGWGASLEDDYGDSEKKESVFQKIAFVGVWAFWKAPRFRGQPIRDARENMETLILPSIAVKSVDYHPDVSEAIAAYLASVIDVFEARRRLSSEPEGTAKEAGKEQGHRKAVYWLISLAALVSLLVGILCLMKSATLQTAGTDPLSLAAEGVPSQGEVTFGQAVQALGVRH
jgi:hypothetical protein